MSRSSSVTTTRRSWGGRGIRAMGLGAGFAAAATTSACLNFNPFGCQDDTQCDAEAMGVCQPAGYCSYPDLACLDTGYRYEENAGDGLGGECVVPMTMTSTTGPTGDATNTATETDDPTTGPTTGPDLDSTSDDGPTTGDDCGGSGQACCPGDMCDPGLSCNDGFCGCVATVAVGDRHTCAIKLDGTVWCWGANDLGQLAAPIDMPPMALEPVQIAGFGPGAEAESIHIRNHNCVRLTDSTVRCWGDNTGLKVNPTAVPPMVTMPEQVSLGAPVTEAGVGGTHTCAALDNDTTACWGANGAFQLGSMDPMPVLPVAVSGVVPNTLALGESHTCASNLLGDLFCWGNNAFGQLGDGTQTNLATPSLVPLMSQIGQVVSGQHHVCVLAGTDVMCWGRNNQGQLGIGTQTDTLTPTLVTFPPGSAAIAELVAGADQTCAVLVTGAIFCWGGNQNGELRLPLDKMGMDAFSAVPVAIDLGGIGVAQLTTGTTHTCALTTTGQIMCWGDNSQGQIGNGTMTDALLPTPAQLGCP